MVKTTGILGLIFGLIALFFNVLFIPLTYYSFVINAIICIILGSIALLLSIIGVATSGPDDSKVIPILGIVVSILAIFIAIMILWLIGFIG